MAGIDRDFWLDFAKDNIPKSIQTRENAAEKLDTFLSFVWTIYTSIFALASLFNYISSCLIQLILVSQPIIVIMAARFYCTLVSIPSSSNSANADPAVVPEIILAFQFIVQDKRRKLKKAQTATIVSMLSISIALIAYNFLDPDKVIKQQIQQMKLKKDLHDQTLVPTKPEQKRNDSIKLVNDYYDYQTQNIIKKRKLECIKSSNQKCLDSLKAFEK